MTLPYFPVRDDDRVERRRRRRALGRRQRIERQVEVESESEDEIVNGVEVESDDESDDDTISSQVQPPAQIQTQVPAVALPPPPAQATTALSTSGSAVMAPAPPATTLITSTSPAGGAPSSANTSVQRNRISPPEPSTTSSPAFQSLETAPSSSSSFNQNPPVSSVPLPVQLLSSLVVLPSTTIPAVPLSTSLSPPTVNSDPLPTPANSRTSSSWPTSSGAASVSTTGTQVEALPESSTAAPPPTKVEGLSRGAMTVIAIISTGAGLAILVYLTLFLYRRFHKHKTTTSSSRSYATRSLWGGSSTASAPTGPLPTYIPPITMQQKRLNTDDFATFTRPNSVNSSTADRQERLGRVRADLLAPRELTEDMVQSATQRQTKGPGMTQSFGPSNNSRSFGSNEGNLGSGGSATVWLAAMPDGSEMSDRQRSSVETGSMFGGDRFRDPARASRVESEASSVPVWRTPVSWVRDQTRRNEGLRRLPG